MDSVLVKDHMISLDDYTTVSVDASLAEAVAALETAWKSAEKTNCGHQKVVVLDASGAPVGVVNQWDVLWALEPKYREIGDFQSLNRFGFYPEFLKSMMDQYELMKKPLDSLCERASKVAVSEIMRELKAGQYIDEGTSLNQAIHQLVVGKLETLLVKRGDEVVGVLRLSDVFREVCTRIHTCSL